MTLDWLMRLKTLLLLLLTLLVPMSSNFITHADKPAFAADLIIINAKIHTMDLAQPLTEAVAILGSRIIAVGSTKDLEKLRGPKTRAINAKGQLVLPSFNDAHVHFISCGFQLSRVDLRDSSTPQQCAEDIRD